MKPRHSHRFFALLVLGMSVVLIPEVHSEPLPPTEYQIKTAFLYNFAKFVEWPASVFKSENDPLVIGVLGEDPFGQMGNTLLEGKTVQNRKLIFKRLGDWRDAEACHILFVAESEKNNLGSIIKALKEKPVLTVSDIPGFVQRGGMISFVMQNRRIRFDINQHAAEATNLKFSSQVLKLARTVK